ncbi:hypothetical protein PZB74_06035 [Porifericola rhodea]|uniref:hypothetical protein n=1 Tax=Porifericola rhodea TaxID=930972 RepID=UPI0026655234|nr:hypothetical protein [Porifericola rhodea]WKN32902.1 hypothetical protein PZB74_06035 [Porifericola rhodea]
MKGLITIHILCLALLWTSESTARHIQAEKAQPSLFPEQVHVQLSEEVISVGESLWFQASLTGEQARSKVLYLELLNEKKAVLQGIYSIKDGFTTGQLSIPDTLRGGWYQIRAYTQWMRNFEEDSYWSQAILIVNPYEDSIHTASSDHASQHSPLTIYPEGGAFVTSLPNRMLAQLALPTKDQVSTAQLVCLQDSAQNTEVTFQSGQATFTVTPNAEYNYALEVYLTHQDTIRKQLPAAQFRGATLQARFSTNKLQIETYHTHKEIYKVELRDKNGLLYSKFYNDSINAIELDRNDIGEGIIELFVQNQEGETIAQRVLYNSSKESIQILLDKNVYKAREKVSAKISVAGALNTSKVAVSVRKLNLLTNHLRLYQQTSGLLSQAVLPEKLQEEEKFKWINESLIAVQPISQEGDKHTQKQGDQYKPEDESLTISGKVESTNATRIGGKVVVLSVPGSNPYFEYDFVDSEGDFEIPIKESVRGMKDIVLQMADTSLQVNWTLDEKFAPTSTLKPGALPRLPDSLLQQALQDYILRTQVHAQYDLYLEQDSSYKQQKKDFRFYGAPNYEIKLDDYITLPNFVEVNRELMPGIRLRESKGSYDLDVFDASSRTFLTGEPSVFLDGVLIHDLDYLVNFSPSEIALIEMVNRRTYYGEYRLDGTIAVYSKQGNAYLSALSPTAKLSRLSLYSPSKPFPKKESPPANQPDFRTLIHWEPGLTLNEDGIVLNFENSDELGIFEIVVEGITQEGQIIRAEKTYKVSLTALP